MKLDTEIKVTLELTDQEANGLLVFLGFVLDGDPILGYDVAEALRMELGEALNV